MRPELPVSGPGRGGRVGASATQHVVQNLVRDTMRDEDVSVGCFLDHWPTFVDFLRIFFFFF
jgi:WD repeat-containing protein 70